jgi:hypothetical protein
MVVSSGSGFEFSTLLQEQIAVSRGAVFSASLRFSKALAGKVTASG